MFLPVTRKDDNKKRSDYLRWSASHGSIGPFHRDGVVAFQ